MQLDLKITGGTLVDGTGAPRRKADIGVRDGKVVAIGTIEGEAKRTIDAAGKIVCPGFVDIHTHYDAQILWDEKLSISPWHGVTTVVMGNCGFGVAPTRPGDRDELMRTLEKVEGMAYPSLKAGLGAEWPFETFPEYMDAIEKKGTAINVAVLAGHTPLRTYVMGPAATEREATSDEVAEMQALVAEAMEAGAIGFATSHAATHNGAGGKPVPSRLASIGEIDALTGTMAQSRRARGLGPGILQATIGRTLFHDQFIELAKAHEVSVSWTALLAGLSGPGSHRKHLERTQAEVDAGLAIVPQVACRPLMFDFHFDEPFPFEMRPLFKATMETDRRGRKAIYADPDFRTNFKADCAPTAKTPIAGWFERAEISYTPGEDGLEGRMLTDVAAERGMDPVDLALDLSIDSDFATRFRFAFFNRDESEVSELLRDPNVVLGLSDAGAHANQLCDACYSTHLLSHWVRETGTLSLERAIHMLTQRPAEIFGITDRGVLAEGRPADIVIFDADAVGASALKRVFDLPAGADRLIADERGIEAVICNGEMVRENGADAGGLPGRLLRSGAAA